MPLHRKSVVIAFAVLQAAGCIGWLANGAAPDPLGKPLWVLGFVALLPGNLIAPPFVERLLWMSPASVTTISLADLSASVAVNAALFTLLAFGSRRLARAVE
jgi:hypothetical protein